MIPILRTFWIGRWIVHAYYIVHSGSTYQVLCFIGPCQNDQIMIHSKSKENFLTPQRYDLKQWWSKVTNRPYEKFIPWSGIQIRTNLGLDPKLKDQVMFQMKNVNRMIIPEWLQTEMKPRFCITSVNYFSCFHLKLQVKLPLKIEKWGSAYIGSRGYD